MITFRQQETIEIKNRITTDWTTFHKYRQELTSQNYILKHRLRLLDAVITPTICYISGTWTSSKEHERMIQSTQRKILHLIIKTKGRFKKIVKHKDKISEDSDNIDSSCTDDESEDEKSSVSHNDQDSDVSFESDNDEEIDAAESRSFNEVMETMENEKIRYWNKTQKKIEMETATRIMTSSSER